MKNGDVITAYETLKRLTENHELKFGVAVGYLLAKNKDKLRQEAILIYNMRQEIIMEHGKVDGNDIIVPNEYIDEVNRKVNELMELENDVQITQIPIQMLDQYQLNMEDIEGLMEIIRPFSLTSPPNEEKTSD